MNVLRASNANCYRGRNVTHAPLQETRLDPTDWSHSLPITFWAFLPHCNSSAKRLQLKKGHSNPWRLL